MRIKYTVILFLTTTLMTIFSLKAQEPTVVSGYGIDEKSGKFISRILAFEKAGASALFIQEQARIAFGYYSNVHILNLTEESAQKTGNQKMGVVYVNNAGKIAPPYSENELITLEVFPIKENDYVSKLSEHYQIPVYFCKHYEHKDSVQQSWMKMYDDFEREITQFLEHPPVGDTINHSFIEMLVDRIDSRYTPLLIKNLTNDGEIIVKYVGHKHTIPASPDDLGKTVEVIHYEPVRISNFVRDRLEWDNVLRNVFQFDVPAANSSAEEWKIWLDDLLKEKNNE